MIESLLQMGLTIWKQRPDAAAFPSIASQGLILELLHDVLRAPYLVLVGPKGYGQKIGSEGKALLKEALKILGWPLKSCAWAEMSIALEEGVSLEEQLQLLGVEKVLVFGKSPVVSFQCPFCVVPSVLDLLGSQERKRRAWEQLQAFEK